MSDRLRIGALAARAAVSVDAIRYYERIGVLPKPARTPAGYREYDTAALNRLGLIRNAQQFGFSLREIAGFLRVRDAGGRPCQEVRDAARRALADVDDQILALRRRRADMRRTLRRWDRQLAATPVDRPARLLENMSAAHA